MTYTMKTFHLSFSLFALLFIFGANTQEVHAQSRQKVEKIKQDAKTAKAEFLESDWRMEKHFKNAYGYVIFPNVGKGAIGIGGAAGNGVAYEGGKEIGMAKLTQLSIGFQWGGQAYREIIFFEDEDAMDRFKQN